MSKGTAIVGMLISLAVGYFIGGYMNGKGGDAPLVASSPGADALSEGDWWNETAAIRRRRDVVILSQRGAGGSTPNLDCFEPRTSEPARAKRRAITEAQEREILLRRRVRSQLCEADMVPGVASDLEMLP